MDRKTAEKLVAVLNQEIATLERDKEEILKLVSDNGTSAPSVQTHSRLARVSEPVRRVYAILSESGGRFSASDVSAALSRDGEEINVARIRQMFHQHKDKLFTSPKRGYWKAKSLDQ